MARARNIKPGFFTNDVLAEVSPLGRILFAGLWTIADRAGRLEDRPKRIKAELLPYDDCDADELLDALGVRGFIRRYQANGAKFIQILAWDKHQNPHIKEAESTIPTFEEHQTSTVLERCSTQPEPEQAGLIVVDLNLVTDSLNHRKDCAPPDGDASPEQTQSSAHRKTSGTPKRAAQLSDDFIPSESHTTLAEELGVSLRDELPQFRDYHRAKGSAMKDWGAALNTWLRNAKKFGGSTHANGTRKPTAAEQRQAVADELCGRNKPSIPAEGAIDGSAKWLD